MLNQQLEFIPISDQAFPTAPTLPTTKKYDCIVIDPPWRYDLRIKDVTHRNRINYESMSIEEIAALNIASLANPDGSVLWLWTTNNHMPNACQVLGMWGYTLKTILTWSKIAANGRPRIGTGHWLRNSTEHCLLATKGKVPSFAHMGTTGGTPTILEASRREHSRKPDEFYSLVERLQPGAHRLEMFARQRRKGWDCWGDQVDHFESGD